MGKKERTFERIYAEQLSKQTFLQAYDEETSNTENAEWAAQYQADEAIVLVSSFVTGSKGGDGSLNPNSTYKDWKWVLTRSGNGPLELQTWGY